MKRGYGLQLIGIGILAVCVAAHASVPTVRIVSTYEMLPDDNAITYLHTSRSGMFSMKITDAPVSTEEVIVADPEYLWKCTPSSDYVSFWEDGAYAHMYLGDKAFGTVYTVTGEVKWKVTDTEPEPDVESTVSARDSITLDTLFFDFTVESDPYDGDGVGTNVMTKGILTDNRIATVTVNARGYSNLDHIKSISFTSTQADPGDVLNKKGTGITFTQDGGSILKWKTTRTYWYGLAPAKCCWSNSHAYKFEMTVNGCCKTSHVYKVTLPKQNAYMEPRIIASRMYIDDLGMDQNSGKYKAKIEGDGFSKIGMVFGTPTSDQYSEETEKEENYHVDQFMGYVPKEKGGDVDCYTSTGVVYFCKRISPTQPIPEIWGSTRAGTLSEAHNILAIAIENEKSESLRLRLANSFFREIKAKEYAGYNAAWKYHCTYLKEGGANPILHKHPAFP